MDDAFRVARELLADDLPRRWEHVQGVQRRAISAALLFGADDATLLADAAILHDIGYSPRVVSTGLHALDGAMYLHKHGANLRLCGLIANHSYASLEAEIRGLSNDLALWQDEMTPLRDALWWADMTTTPDGSQTDVHSRISEIRERYGPHDVVTVFIQRAARELMNAVERTEERLRAAGLGHLAK